MANEKTHEVQKVEQAEVTTTSEQTRTGPAYTPAVDIFESEDGITVLADMPGVKPEDLKIDLHENVLTMTGDVSSLEADAETDVFREFAAGQFYRQFTLSDRINQDKIEAGLTDGVLRLVLPRAEAAKPRQIKVKTS